MTSRVSDNLVESAAPLFCMVQLESHSATFTACKVYDAAKRGRHFSFRWLLHLARAKEGQRRADFDFLLANERPESAYVFLPSRIDDLMVTSQRLNQRMWVDRLISKDGVFD